MLVKQELINKIKDYFDLNVYETKVWLALIGKGSASAGEIAEISGVPRSRTYDVLETLEKKGFAIVKLGKPVKYLGIKPKMILEKLRNNVRTEADEKIQSLSNIKDTEEFAQLEELYKGGIEPIKREDISAALKGKSNISNYLREIIREAKKEVLICANAKDILLKTKLFQQTFDVLKKANIKIKLCLSGEDDLIKKAETEFGIKIKKVDINAKFFIIDRSEILFYLSKPDSKEDSAIWLNSNFFSEYFASLFELAMGDKNKMAENNYYKIKECATGKVIGTFYGDTTQMYNLCNSINVNWKDNKGKVAVAEVVREGNYRKLTKNLAKKLLNKIMEKK